MLLLPSTAPFDCELKNIKWPTTKRNNQHHTLCHHPPSSRRSILLSCSSITSSSTTCPPRDQLHRIPVHLVNVPPRRLPPHSPALPQVSDLPPPPRQRRPVQAPSHRYHTPGKWSCFAQLLLPAHCSFGSTARGKDPVLRREHIVVFARFRYFSIPCCGVRPSRRTRDVCFGFSTAGVSQNHTGILAFPSSTVVRHVRFEIILYKVRGASSISLPPVIQTRRVDCLASEALLAQQDCSSVNRNAVSKFDDIGGDFPSAFSVTYIPKHHGKTADSFTLRRPPILSKSPHQAPKWPTSSPSSTKPSTGAPTTLIGSRRSG